MINISTFKDPPITTHIKLKPHKTHQNKLKKKENQKGIKKKKASCINKEQVCQQLAGWISCPQQLDSVESGL